jgi:hypothetical protein
VNAQIKADALEYGAHIRSGGWRLGLLVARSVEKGAGSGRPPKNPSGGRQVSGKASIEAFAKQAGVGRDRVRTHLNGWNNAAEDGIVPSSENLSVGQDVPLDIEALPAWSAYYAPVSGGWNGDETRPASPTDVQKVIRAAGPANLTEAMGDPETRMRAEGAASRSREIAHTEARSERRAGGRVSVSESGAGRVVTIGGIMADLSALADRLSDAWEHALRDCSDEQIEAIKGRVAIGAFKIGRVLADIQGTGIDAALAEMLKGGVNTDE